MLGTEPAERVRFTPAMLFRGPLAAMTPLLWGAAFCSSAVVFYLVFWGPILNERLGFSASAAVTLAALTSLVGAFGQLAVARFVDRHGARTIAFLALTGLPCLLVIGFAPLGKAAYVAVLLFANFFIIGAQGSMGSISGIFYRPAIRAAGTSWASSAAKVGAMTGPQLAGFIMDHGFDTRSTFYVFALFPLLMAVLLFTLGHLQRQLPPTADGTLRPAAAPAGAARSGEPVA